MSESVEANVKYKCTAIAQQLIDKNCNPFFDTASGCKYAVSKAASSRLSD
jgi:hypothetical protein